MFPFLRTHTILESLQPAMVSLPVVMFFPGEYVHEENGGIGAASLRLAGESAALPTLLSRVQSGPLPIVRGT